LHCLAYMNGNILAYINDGAADPMAEDPDYEGPDANVQLVAVAIGRFPFMFVVATKDIEAGNVFGISTESASSVPGAKMAKSCCFLILSVTL